MRCRAFRRHGRPVPVLLVLALVLASCESGTTPPDPDPEPAAVASVALSADSLRIIVDGQGSLAATLRDAQGQLLTGRTVAWSSSNPGVATVSAGAIQAASVGRAVITATSEGVRAEAQLRVFDVNLKDNAVEADSVFVLTSTLQEIQQGVLRYQNKGTGKTLAVGDVLVGSKPGGGAYLRKVASVSQAGGTQTAQTVATTFDQLVDSLDLEIVIKETFQSALQRDLASGQLTASDLPQGVSVNPDGSLQLSDLQLAFDFDESGQVGCCAQVSASLSGHFAFLMGPEIFPGADPYVFRLKTFLGVPQLFHFEATAAAELDITASASVTAGLGEGWTRSKEVFRRQIFPALPAPCIWKGPVCYSLSVVIDAYATVKAGATASVSQHFTTMAGATAGVLWQSGVGFTPILAPITSWEAGAPVVSLEGGMSLEVGLRPNLEFDVYEGLANVSAGIDGGVEAGITANLWEWNAEAALFLDVFAEAELSFWGLVDERAELRYPDLARYVIATHGGPMVRLQVTPDPVTVPVGGTAQATARAISLFTNNDIGIAPPVDWEVEVPGLVSIDGSGRLTGISPGTSRFKATIQGTGIVSDNPYPTVTVTADAGPAFEIVAPDLSFDHVVGMTSCPQPLGSFTVTNHTPVDGQLQVTAPSQLTFRRSGGSAQAGSFNATVGPGTTEFLVRFNCTLAESFSQDVTVEVSNNRGSANETFTVTGTIREEGEPSIALSSYHLFFDATLGGASPASQEVGITNAGEGALTGLMRAIEYRPGDPTGWLTASLGSTTAPATLTVTTTTGALAAGSYEGVILLSSPLVDGETALYVTFRVTDGSAPGVDGWNVTHVAYSGLGGGAPMCEFQQVGPREWVECSTFNFVETARDDWSVYLYDASRGISVQLDLYTDIVSWSNADTPKTSLYAIVEVESAINGRLVSRVEYGGLNGGGPSCDFRQVGPTEWVECSAFNFAEIGRDEWSVYLHDASRGVYIQLDLYTGIVYYSDAGIPKTPLYAIVEVFTGGW